MNIGILGGTFDPIHEGHLTIADYVLEKFKLERIEFIPCFKPPHRNKPIASPHDRLEMLKLAIKNYSAFSVNETEIKHEGISYTINTVELLQKLFPDNRYFYIIGADAFTQFNTWHEWEKIISLAHIIIVSRNHYDITIPTEIAKFIEENELKNHIQFCTMDPILISATHIRDEIAAHKRKIDGLPRLVHEYIVKHHLYS